MSPDQAAEVAALSTFAGAALVVAKGLTEVGTKRHKPEYLTPAQTWRDRALDALDQAHDIIESARPEKPAVAQMQESLKDLVATVAPQRKVAS